MAYTQHKGETVYDVIRITEKANYASLNWIPKYRPSNHLPSLGSIALITRALKTSSAIQTKTKIWPPPPFPLNFSLSHPSSNHASSLLRPTPSVQYINNNTITLKPKSLLKNIPTCRKLTNHKENIIKLSCPYSKSEYPQRTSTENPTRETLKHGTT